jgi:GalNAc-alpha-(1->4)-GalNAc-alpha-(1->3)-diNAcBac-PP-undecaprenol alpha-1,4-N-acetyl-D-galactosaminyltransferase
MPATTKICLIVPSLKAGGMERVMAEVANYLSEDSDLEVHLILFSDRENFFKLLPDVHIHRPDYDSRNKFKLIINFGRYLRGKLKEINPVSVLSFGSMYNSFVLLFSRGLGINVYVSDRSNPYRNTELTFRKDPIKRHDGILHYFLKKILYKKAAGILVQTEKAKEIEANFSGHHNIILFPNPVRDIKEYPEEDRENWIINVGRFINTKNQLFLIEAFGKIRFGDWKLVFAGDGPQLEKAKKIANDLKLSDHIYFLGNVNDVDRYLRKSEIFAYPSTSEGFPNALTEAMKSSLACIAYDCVAGPSDIISDGINGILVEVGDRLEFQNKLEELMKDSSKRSEFQNTSAKAMDKFNKDEIIENLKRELVEI